MATAAQQTAAAAAPADTRFRMIKEGTGGTLYFHPDLPNYSNQPSRVGTYMLHSCVGVYFQVSETRCFVAHMDGRTPGLEQWLVVTHNAGLLIKAQVKQRLLGFLKNDQWDIRKSWFGNDLHLQCPQHYTHTFDGRFAATTGWYIARGIREFFVACSMVLAEEADQRRNEGPAENLRLQDKVIYQAKTEQLSQQAAKLQNDGMTNEVERGFHAFIKIPGDDGIYMTGEMKKNGDRASRNDLGEHVPIDPGP